MDHIVNDQNKIDTNYKTENVLFELHIYYKYYKIIISKMIYMSTISKEGFITGILFALFVLYFINFEQIVVIH